MATVATAGAIGATAALPTPLAATVVGNGILVRFDRQLADASSPAAFVVTINGRPSLPATVSLNGRSLRIALPQSVYSDDTVRLTYAPFRVAAAHRLRDSAGRRVERFVLDAANRGPAGCVDPLGRVSVGVADEGPTDRATFVPSTGTIGLAYVPVDFSDTRDGVQRGSNPSAGAVPPALDSIIREMSYGKLSASLAPSVGVARMSKLSGAYGLGVVPTWEGAKPFLAEAMAIASNATDFSKTNVVFVNVYAKQGTPVPSGLTGYEPSYPLVAPAGQGITVDGKEIRAFIFLKPNFTQTAEYLLNPFLRTLGLPKLVDRQDQLGGWDAAAYSAPGRVGLLAWHRRKLGWLDPSQVRCIRRGSAEIVLQPVTRSGGTKLVIAPISGSAAITVELRRREGLDQQLCGEGLLVARVDTRIPIRDPLVTPPIRIVTTRPVSYPPFGSPLFGCQALFDQTLDTTVPQTATDGVTIRFVRDNPDGSAVVSITR